MVVPATFIALELPDLHYVPRALTAVPQALQYAYSVQWGRTVPQASTTRQLVLRALLETQQACTRFPV